MTRALFHDGFAGGFCHAGSDRALECHVFRIIHAGFFDIVLEIGDGRIYGLRALNVFLPYSGLVAMGVVC